MADREFECQGYDLCDSIFDDIKDAYRLFRYCDEIDKRKPGYCSICPAPNFDEGRPGD